MPKISIFVLRENSKEASLGEEYFGVTITGVCAAGWHTTALAAWFASLLVKKTASPH